jgi:hypothetical protein
MARFDKDAVRRANPIERVIPALLNELAHEVGGEIKVRCPWHEDTRPSLRINPVKAVWHCDPCAKGGDIFRFVKEWRGCTFSDALRFLAERAGLNGSSSASARREIATYDYTDETGALLYQVVRFEPKNFRQRRPDGADGWIWNLNGTRRVLYRLPELKDREAVFVPEGEKDVDRAWSLGLPATCNLGGAGKWRDEYAGQLVAAGVKRVAVIPDADDPGRAHAEDVARSCHHAGLAVRVVTLPDVPPKGDLSDYLTTHTKDDLLATIRAAPPYVPPADPMPPVAAVAGPMPAGNQPVLVRMADVQPEEVSWIWPTRVARRKLNLIVGDPGLGKSTMGLDLAARISRGLAWPDTGIAPRGDAVILTAEDGLADTVRPRLDLHDADVARVHVLRAVRDVTGAERAVSLATDLGPLEQAIVSTQAVLVVIDPISAYLGMANSYRDSEVRAILAPLHALAERTGAAIVGVMHLTKDQQRQALYRGQGSIAFVGAARLVLAVGADPDDESRERRFLMPVKSNVCAPAATLAYRIMSVEGRGRLTWETDAVDGVDVNAVLAPQRPEDTEARREAEVFLREYLKDGPARFRDIERAAKAENIATRTLYRAKKVLGIESDKVGFQTGQWYWRLPEQDDPAANIATAATNTVPKIAIPADVAIFGTEAVNSLDFSGSDTKIANVQDEAIFEAPREPLADTNTSPSVSADSESEAFDV